MTRIKCTHAHRLNKSDSPSLLLEDLESRCTLGSAFGNLGDPIVAIANLDHLIPVMATYAFGQTRHLPQLEMTPHCHAPVPTARTWDAPVTDADDVALSGSQLNTSRLNSGPASLQRESAQDDMRKERVPDSYPHNDLDAGLALTPLLDNLFARTLSSLFTSSNSDHLTRIAHSDLSFAADALETLHTANSEVFEHPVFPDGSQRLDFSGITSNGSAFSGTSGAFGGSPTPRSQYRSIGLTKPTTPVTGRINSQGDSTSKPFGAFAASRPGTTYTSPQSTFLRGGGAHLASTENDGDVLLNIDDFIPLNADNDNGSVMTDHVPAVRDFSATNLQVDDPEIKPVTVWTSLPPGGGYWLSVSYSGTGRIKFWADQKKTTAWPTDAAWISENDADNTQFYVEGTHESIALNDIQVTLNYQVDIGGETLSAHTSMDVSVTPVLLNGDFTLTPAATPNVFWKEGTDGQSGLKTNSGLTPGIVMNAKFYAASLGGYAIFVQNATSVDNGNTNGWEFEEGSGIEGLDTKLSGGATFPILDASAISDLSYDIGLQRGFTNDQPAKTTLQVNDSPRSGAPDPSVSVWLSNINVTFNFTIYLEWFYDDDSIYTVAQSQWKVVFKADTYEEGHGVTHIDASSKITADGASTRTNEDIPQQGRKSPKFNETAVIE